MSIENLWLNWAVELQSIAQNGLTYCKDDFDKERYERLREISAEIISQKSDITLEKVRDLFCNETGYQTPKIDTRAAIFEENKILLVKENNGLWSLPGGWCDVTCSVKENIIKEVKEEAGLNITVDTLIAVQDRSKHNEPIYAHSICKMFFLCTKLSGSFSQNTETLDSKYFALDELPSLAEEKTTNEQIVMCFNAQQSKQWTTQFD